MTQTSFLPETDVDDEPITLWPYESPTGTERTPTIQDLLARRVDWEDRLVQLLLRNPLESLGTFLVGSSAAFYAAEHGVNPRIRTFWDALYYITTCASVGYADVFAQTALGKTIASVVFTFGPSLCAKVFDRPNAPASSSPDLQPLLDRLDGILAELRKAKGTAATLPNG